MNSQPTREEWMRMIEDLFNKPPVEPDRPVYFCCGPNERKLMEDFINGLAPGYPTDAIPRLIDIPRFNGTEPD